MAVVDGKMKSRLLHRDTHIGLTFSYYVYGDDASTVRDLVITQGIAMLCPL